MAKPLPEGGRRCIVITLNTRVNVIVALIYVHIRVTNRQLMTNAGRAGGVLLTFDYINIS